MGISNRRILVDLQLTETAQCDHRICIGKPPEDQYYETRISTRACADALHFGRGLGGSSFFGTEILGQVSEHSGAVGIGDDGTEAFHFLELL